MAWRSICGLLVIVAAAATVFRVATADDPEVPAAADVSDFIDPASPAASPPPAEPPVDRVRATIDVSGELFAPAGRDAPPIRRPIVVAGRFDFIERPLASADEPTVERRYADAAADLQIDGQPERMTLPEDARAVRIVLRGTMPAPSLENGFLTREELDLLEMPFDPLLIDALRPTAGVAVGDSWSIAGDVTAGLLAIDTVESGSLDASLEVVEDGRATVKLAGIIDGAADGVPTHVTVEGSFTAAVDDAAADPVMLTGRISQLAVTLRERREASHVAPGFDVEARVVIARAAVANSGGDSSSTAAAPAGASADATMPRRQGVGRPGLVWHRDRANRYDLVHDERWRVIEDGVEGLVMRFVDRGALVAQCSITALPRSSALSPPTIAEVERDIERSLAGQFARIEHASEATRSDGVRIVRVVTGGRAGELPFRWIHHVLTDAAGHRLAVTCMLEESLQKRFGDADRDLVDGIMFPAGEAESTPETVDTEGPPADREARLPAESRTP
ncbi:MAG: hypothetical protein ACR2IT_11685 [Pirellulales bacterium]